MKGIFYNENDPRAAAWLRELMAAGLIAPGVVDERSICDLKGEDLYGFTQCHFFAGIGGWSAALRLAGWPDERGVWTGSCPCQPFSNAGRRLGERDERHLWPVWKRLIEECRPAVVFGEQVASKDGRGWLAGVRADLEGMGYAAGGADLCAAGVGAPHIRQRLYWVGVAAKGGWGSRGAGVEVSGETARGEAERSGAAGGVECADGSRCEQYGGAVAVRSAHASAECAGGAGWVADADEGKRGRVADGEGCERDGEASRREQGDGESESGGAVGGVADADGSEQRGGELRLHADSRSNHGASGVEERAPGGVADAAGFGGAQHGGRSRGREEAGANDAAECGGVAGGVEHSAGERREQWGAESVKGGAASGCGFGFWDGFDLVPCADGKARRVESGTFPLAHGVSGRVGLLRGYGNAIVPQVAAVFVECVVGALDDARGGGR